jgi:hypothetical protein
MAEDFEVDKLTIVAQEETDLYGGHTFGWKAF